MLTLSKHVAGFKQKDALSEVERLDQHLYHHFEDKFHLDLTLSRSIVSFQANKTREAIDGTNSKKLFLLP